MPNIVANVGGRHCERAPSFFDHRVERGMRLIRLMAEKLPAGAVIAGGPIDPGIGFQIAAEEALACPMLAKRRQEFAAGRHCARAALRALGCAPAPIPVRPSRAPAWPRGIVGTLSHGRARCAAVLARHCDLLSIGIKIEATDPLPAELVTLVWRSAELSARSSIERSIGTDLPKLVFVLAEVFCKAYRSVAGSFLEFVDVKVTIDSAACAFEARVVSDGRPSCAGHRALCGRFGRLQDTLFASAWLTSSGVRDCHPPRQVG